jgi:arylsulfatase A-like enzyme
MILYLFLTSFLCVNARPNILIFLIDDMGYSDLSVYGSKNHSTPNIERLAKRGTRFTNWISGSSICTPSRASIQTGRYAARTGCTGNVEQYRVIPTPSSPYVKSHILSLEHTHTHTYTQIRT